MGPSPDCTGPVPQVDHADDLVAPPAAASRRLTNAVSEAVVVDGRLAPCVEAEAGQKGGVSSHRGAAGGAGRAPLGSGRFVTTNRLSMSSRSMNRT